MKVDFCLPLILDVQSFRLLKFNNRALWLIFLTALEETPFLSFLALLLNFIFQDHAVRSCIELAKRNQLPVQLQEQMPSHI